MKTSIEIAELAKALARAQGQFTAAERAHTARVQSKKGEGSSYSYNYADLQAYLDVVREPLAGAGLSFVQLPTVKGDEASVVTILMHESGQFIESDPLCLVADHEPDKRPTPQAIGSAITYARRYSLSAVTGMASEADDDGAAASGLNAETGKRQPLPPCPQCGHNNHVIIGRPEYGGGFVCYGKKGGCGAKWHDPVQELAATQPGLTTGDKIAPPKEKSAYELALETIAKAEKDGDLVLLKKVAERIRDRHGEGLISDEQDAKLTSRLIDAEDAINAASDVAKAKSQKKQPAAA